MVHADQLFLTGCCEDVLIFFGALDVLDADVALCCEYWLALFAGFSGIPDEHFAVVGAG